MPYSVCSLSILITTSVLNSASDRLAISISFSSFFLGFCSVLSFGPYFFASSIWQPPCICFYVVGRAALTPCFSSMTYVAKAPVNYVRQSLRELPGWGNLLHCCPSSCCPGVCIHSKSMQALLVAKIQQFLLLSQPPLVFTARDNGDLSFRCWNPGLCGLAWGWYCSFLGIPANFYPPHMNVGPSVPLPLLCHHLSVPYCLSVPSP